MTRTDGLVSSWPQTAGDASIDGEPRHPVRATDRRAASRRLSRRGLLALPAALALIALAGPALAAGTETSGYGQKAPAPKTTATEPSKGTAPTKESTTPATTTPATSTEPATTSTSPKASTLPFTGLDLRWLVGAGALMLAAGFSLRLVQGRRRHGPGS
jgi:hypothetical protein